MDMGISRSVRYLYFNFNVGSEMKERGVFYKSAGEANANRDRVIAKLSLFTII